MLVCEGIVVSGFDLQIALWESGSSKGAFLAAISRIRCRAKEDGLPRRGVGSVLSSEFSGCVGSIFRRLGLALLVLGVVVGAGGRMFDSCSGCAAGPMGGDCLSVPSCVSVVAGSAAGRRINVGSFKETKGAEGGLEGDDEVRNSRLPQSFILVLSPSSERSSRSTVWCNLIRARSGRARAFVILGL